MVAGGVVKSDMAKWHKSCRTESIWEQGSQDLEAAKMPTPTQGTNTHWGTWNVEALEDSSEGPAKSCTYTGSRCCIYNLTLW